MTIPRELGDSVDTESHENIDREISELFNKRISTEPQPSTSTNQPIAIEADPVELNKSESVACTNSGGNPESVALDNSMLEILGEDPTATNTYGAEIHKDLAARLEHKTIHGMSKKICKELNDEYLTPINCKLIDAPVLNAEIKVAISEATAKRDKNMEFKQKQIATAISCLSQAINKLFSCKDADKEMIKMFMDTTRIICVSQYNESVIRKKYILSSLKKDLKDQLQNIKPDTFLFGENLSETFKAAKAIIKSGTDLRLPAPKPRTKPSTNNTSKNLNWKGLYQSQKSSSCSKTKERPSNRNTPSSSSSHINIQCAATVRTSKLTR